MEKFVLVYNDNDYDNEREHVVPFLAETKEAFIAAFKVACDEAIAYANARGRQSVYGIFNYKDIAIGLNDYVDLAVLQLPGKEDKWGFRITYPEIFTLEEWFAKFSK